MSKDFEEYRLYCKEKGLKKFDLNNLQAFLEYKENKIKKNNNFLDSPLQVVLPITNKDKLQIIEDYYLWANNRDYCLDYCSTYILYQKYLLGGAYDK